MVGHPPLSGRTTKKITFFRGFPGLDEYSVWPTRRPLLQKGRIKDQLTYTYVTIIMFIYENMAVVGRV